MTEADKTLTSLVPKGMITKSLHQYREIVSPDSGIATGRKGQTLMTSLTTASNYGEIARMFAHFSYFYFHLNVIRQG